MANIKKNLLQQQKNRHISVVERKSFDVKTLTQRKTNLQDIIEEQPTMNEVLGYIQKNANYAKEIGDLKPIITQSERLIKDVRYRSSKVEHF